MSRFIVRRFAAMILVMVLLTMIVFGLSHATGDPRYMYMSEYSTGSTSAEMWEAQGKRLGLDKPLHIQYGLWLGRSLKGDFGTSLTYNKNSIDVISEGLTGTLQLTSVSFVFAILLGVPLGVLSAVKRATFWDYLGRSFALIGQSAPPFWIAIVCIFVFAVYLGWLPTSRRGDWTHYVLPVITLGWMPASALLRLVRSSTLEVLDSEFVKLAKAKGVSNTTVIWKHAFRNSLIAPLTFTMVLLAGFLTGTVVTETVFAWPGLGRMAVRAALNMDFPLITALAMVFGLMFLFTSFIADVIYGLVDPRIRYDR